MQRIFKGLELNLEEAYELAIYLKVAKGDVGVIHTNGYMTTAHGTWERPCATQNYAKLRKALERTPNTEGIILERNTISFDPECIQYDLKAIRRFIAINHLGVKNSQNGLLIFRQREASHTGVWYERILWEFHGITTAMLDTNTAKIVKITPIQGEADWKTLYFVA